MSDHEKFLTRWSRRKRDTPNETAQAEKPAVADKSSTQEVKSDQSIVAHPLEADVQPAPEFDLTKLPSLDSIGANSDVTAFFQPGVPSALKHAALRRVWAADPAIRDFVGLAENAWDFTDPEAMPGFGALDPKYDVKKLVGEIFREAQPGGALPAQTPASAQLAQLPDKTGTSADIPAANEPAKVELQQVASSESSTESQCGADGAMQHNDLNESSELLPAGIKLRRHGSALPH
jgi:hypothetical protein